MTKTQFLFWFFLASLVVFRYCTTRPSYQDGDRIRITTTVSSEPVVYDRNQYLKLKGLKVYLPLLPAVYYGDKVTIEGIVDGDTLKSPHLLKLEESTNSLLVARQKILAFYKLNLPEPHASLVAGIVLGSKQSMPANFWEKLKNTGTAHIVVASGTNVVLVGGFVLSTLTNYMVRKKALVWTCLAIWLYVVVAGFEPPLVRAAIMATLAFTAQAFGRLGDSKRILALTVAFMLIVNPNWLLDIGFILSCTATLSLILFQAKVYKLIHFVPGILRQDLATTLAAQIGVAPILYFSFGYFNLWSPFINVLVLWTIPLITLLGMLAGILALIVPQVARLIAFLVYPLLSYFVTIIEHLG